MTTSLTIEREVHFQRRRHGRKELRDGAAPACASLPPGRVPRVARLLALAHRFHELLRGGAVKDFAELARLGRVTRARISQVMNLLNLAPAIQEEILGMEPVAHGRDRISERGLRNVVAEPLWGRQLEDWEARLARSGRRADDSYA